MGSPLQNMRVRRLPRSEEGSMDQGRVVKCGKESWIVFYKSCACDCLIGRLVKRITVPVTHSPFYPVSCAAAIGPPVLQSSDGMSCLTCQKTQQASERCTDSRLAPAGRVLKGYKLLFHYDRLIEELQLSVDDSRLLHRDKLSTREALHCIRPAVRFSLRQQRFLQNFRNRNW